MTDHLIGTGNSEQIFHNTFEQMGQGQVHVIKLVNTVSVRFILHQKVHSFKLYKKVPEFFLFL